MSPKYCFHIQGLMKDTAFNQMSFGRQTEYYKQIEAFKAIAKRGYIGAKRKTTARGFREFKALYEPTQWFYIDRDNGSLYHDDSTDIWYTVGSTIKAEEPTA
jgi:hypothetical protein